MGSLRVVGTIVAKDLRLFTRDRFYVFVTVLGLVAYVGLFWALPSTVEENIRLGVHLPGEEALLAERLAMAGDTEQGIAAETFGSAAALEDAVRAGGDVVAGLDFPPGFVASTAAGEVTTVRVLLTGDAPEDLRPVLAGAVREIAFAVSGQEPPVTLPRFEEMVLGVDRAGDPVPLREQLRPMIVFLVLLVEMLALASLVALEIAQRTVSAVLVTPARVGHVLAAKGLLGTVLAFSQVLLIGLLTGTFAHSPGLVAVTLLLGAVLVTGFGLVAGATGQDFIAIVFWSMLFLVPLAIPAFSVLFPGTPALWVQALPSYGLVETLFRVVAYGEGWAETWPYVALLAGWCVAAFGAGSAILGWRFARL
jgi:ABC-2 type transport system permease protein